MAPASKKSSKTRLTSHKRALADTWLLEIGSLVLGICALTVIIILLAHYDGKQQFQWNGVTLNAVVAVLATITRIGIVVPVAEALAQWKWMHFSKAPKLLSDFGLLDDASRGTRGSMLLLWEKKSLTLTSIGAWIVVLSIAVEPFFQQIISFEDAVSYQDDSNVKATYTALWDGGSFESTPPDAFASSNDSGLYENVNQYGSVSDLDLDFQAQAAVLFGLSTTLKSVNQQLKISCPSGNCTWPSYLTLGTCSKCKDVTDQVSRAEKVDYPMEWHFPGIGRESGSNGPIKITQYSLPNGLSLDNRNPNQYYVDQSSPVLLTARSNLAPSQSVSFKTATTLLWSAAILQVLNASSIDGYGQWIDPTAQNVQATECALYLCIKEYKSEMLNGQILENFVDIASTRDADSWQVFFNTDGPPEDVVGYVYGQDVSDAVNALYTNKTYLPRTDLSITVRHIPATDDPNTISTVNATQGGIYALSAYLDTLFASTTFSNTPIDSASQFNCTLNSTSIPCGELHNVTGMVILPEALTSTSTPRFGPPAMSALYAPTKGREHLASVFTTLAESITNTMRSSATSSTISGKLGTSHTLLRVRWPWLTLPLLCLVVSAGFLLFSIYEAQVDSTPIWKSSGLPYLAHGLDAQSREKIQYADLSSEIDHVAEEISVHLSRGGEEGVLMLRGDDAHELKPLSPGSHGSVDT